VKVFIGGAKTGEDKTLLTDGGRVLDVTASACWVFAGMKDGWATRLNSSNSGGWDGRGWLPPNPRGFIALGQQHVGVLE